MPRARTLFFVLGLVACGSTKHAPADAGTEDSGDPDAGGCPVPPVVTPPDTSGKGFLAPVKVGYVRTVDGDTAHFVLPNVGERTFRFLYVNTEESSGARATAFGIATVPIVRGWLEAAADLQVAIQDDGQGAPKLDPFQRILALVFTDGTLLQSRLVLEGASAYYALFGCAPSPIHESLLWSEAEAFGAQRGIWAPGHPTNYREVLASWNVRMCRPNPFESPYCP